MAAPYRPVGARALKSTMDTLRPYLTDSRVLDLYAGQGRFGLSALSEGASRVTFVERDRKACSEIARELERHHIETRFYQILNTDTESYLAHAVREKASFDLIFCDPPFPAWNADFSATLWQQVHSLLSEGGIFLVKYPRRMVLSLPNEAVWKTTPFGESLLVYCKK